MIRNGAISFVSFALDHFRSDLNANNSFTLKQWLKMDSERYKVVCRIVYYKLTDHQGYITWIEKQ